jgi:hypothetical protein
MIKRGGGGGGGGLFYFSLNPSTPCTLCISGTDISGTDPDPESAVSEGSKIAYGGMGVEW